MKFRWKGSGRGEKISVMVEAGRLWDFGVSKRSWFFEGIGKRDSGSQGG